MLVASLGVYFLRWLFLNGSAPSSALCVPLKGSLRLNAALCHTVRDTGSRGMVREKFAESSENQTKGKGHLFVYQVAREDGQASVGPRAAFAGMANSF